MTARLELERTDEERKRLLAAAEAAARAKDEFLAMLGHELRNPLAPIVTALNLMKTKGDDHIGREREIIERQAKRLVRLVDELLDASRLAQGKVELKRTRVALTDVIPAAVEVVAPLLEKKHHRLRVDVPKHGLDLEADPMRLSQVIANLLTNAARYTPDGGDIDVIASRHGDEVTIQVDDNGVGVPVGELPNLFNMFFQGPRRNDRSEGGLGLGLALVKSLVELHSGKVAARSQGPGRGSSFEVTLPLAKAPMAAPGTPAATPSPSSPDRRASRVLLVDDNRDLADVLALFLQESGCAVWVANDGPSALAPAREVRPSVAVVDIGLPMMDGYELAARMRTVLDGDAPRMIAMSGYGQAADKERSQRAGFERHLVKPVDGTVLLGALDG